MSGLGATFLVGLAFGAPPRFEGTLGFKTNPWGLGLFGNLYWDPYDSGPVDLDVGPGLAVYFFWYELQSSQRLTLLDGFVVATGQFAAEPGIFLRADDPDGPRVPSLRPLGRGRVELNLRNDALWLYSRSTGWTRHRPWAEYDPFRDTVFAEGLELSGEHSDALMVSPSGSATRKLWFYVEYTLEASLDVGWLDQVARGGVIVEKATPALSFDLDLYYSFMDSNIGGPGALLVMWYAPPARDAR